MHLKSTPAVVVHSIDYGESDVIITFLTPAHGRMTGIARGAKRSKKRFVNKLELFSLLDVQYQENKRSTLIRIDQAELLNSFPKLREDYPIYVGACLICELLRNWTRENDENVELFNLLVWALASLNSGQSPTKTVIFFQSRLFTHLGYRPQLNGCVECGSISISNGPYRFSANKCGIICATCTREQPDSQMPISLNTAKLLHRSMELPIEKLDRLHFSDKSVEEALNILKRYGHHLLQKDIRTWHLLSQCH